MRTVLQGTLLSVLAAIASLGVVAGEPKKVRGAGDINLQGRVVYSTCAIGAPDVTELVSWQEGHVVSTEWTERKLFDIRLSECTSSVSQHVSARFNGIEEDDMERFTGRSNADKKDVEVWNWSDGRVAIRVDDAPELLYFKNGPVFRFESKFKFLVPMSSESHISVPIYFLVDYP